MYIPDWAAKEEIVLFCLNIRYGINQKSEQFGMQRTIYEV